MSKTMPAVRSYEALGSYTIRGVIDFKAYLTDADGRWLELDTSNHKEWSLIPHDLQNTQGGVMLTALEIFRLTPEEEIKSRLKEITDEDLESFLTREFGDS
jgi:hypothetical protein